MSLPPPDSPNGLWDLPAIPPCGGDLDASAYRDVPVDLAAPEQFEPLVDIRSFGLAGEAYYHRSDGGNPPYHQRLSGSLPQVFVREGVAKKLCAANKDLAPFGVELFLWDGFRPAETQQGIWDFFERRFRAEHPEETADKIYQRVIRFVSDPSQFNPDDPRSWSTHMTGASVDLTLRSVGDGRLLVMGAHFDQMTEEAATGYFEQQLGLGLIEDTDARLFHRRLLYYAMAGHGFTNYPHEFWHFDWGNQLHRLIEAAQNGTNPRPAVYGAVVQD